MSIQKNKKTMLALTAGFAISVLSGCATTSSPGYGYGPNYDYGQRPVSHQHDHYGVVTSVRWVSDHRAGGGAVLGAIIGGVVGNQIGSGSGRALATGAGVAAGATIGNNIEQNRRDMQQVIDIRLQGGGVMTITQGSYPEFYVGQNVRVVGNGQRLRVIHPNSPEYNHR